MKWLFENVRLLKLKVKIRPGSESLARRQIMLLISNGSLGKWMNDCSEGPDRERGGMTIQH